MSNRPSLDDYIDVAERIAEFNTKYPDGTLQTIDWEPRDIGGRTFIVYRAAAYRTPDDERPGHGIAWEPFPGPTQFTKDSELMNAETAAWGRAIVACGIVANRKIASRQEVKARQQDVPKVDFGAAAAGLSGKQIREVFTSCGLTAPDADTPPWQFFTNVPADKATLLVEALRAVER